MYIPTESSKSELQITLVDHNLSSRWRRWRARLPCLDLKTIIHGKLATSLIAEQLKCTRRQRKTINETLQKTHNQLHAQ